MSCQRAAAHWWPALSSNAGSTWISPRGAFPQALTSLPSRPFLHGSRHLRALSSKHSAWNHSSVRLAGAGVGIDWLIDMRLARAPLLWAGLLCFSAATFLGTLAHVARLKGLKALR